MKTFTLLRIVQTTALCKALIEVSLFIMSILRRVIIGGLLLSFGWPARALDLQMAAAEKLIRAGNQDEAKEKIGQYLRAHESAAAYIEVGNVYARLKRWPDAVHYLEIATTRDDKSALAWYELGIAQHQNNQVDDAVASLRKAISDNSKWEKPVLALGEILEFAHDRYDARNVYLAATKKVGERPLFRAKLCWLFFQDAFWRETIKQCRRAHDLNPRDSQSWALLGQAYYESDQRPQAFAVFKALLKEIPNSQLAYKARGLDYFKEKSYEIAVGDLGKAFGLDANDEESAIVLARSLYELGQYKLALIAYREAARLQRSYRFEILAKQRDLSKKGKDELAAEYEATLDKL